MYDVNPTLCPHIKHWIWEDISITIFPKEAIGVIEITISKSPDDKIVIQILQEKYNDKLFSPEGKAAVSELMLSLLRTKYRELNKNYLYRAISNWAEEYIRKTNVTNVNFHTELGVSAGFKKTPDGKPLKVSDILWHHRWLQGPFPRKFINDISVKPLPCYATTMIEVILANDEKPQVVVEVILKSYYERYDGSVDAVNNFSKTIRASISSIDYKNLSKRDLLIALIQWAKALVDDNNPYNEINIYWSLGYSVQLKENHILGQGTTILFNPLNLINPF